MAALKQLPAHVYDSAGVPPSAQRQFMPHNGGIEALPAHVYIMQDVDTDMEMEELQQRVQAEPWFKERALINDQALL